MILTDSLELDKEKDLLSADELDELVRHCREEGISSMICKAIERVAQRKRERGTKEKNPAHE